MKHEQADIWEHWERGHKIVVTTNVGWDPDRAGYPNNMGAGLALQAAKRWPWLPSWYGNHCRLWITRWRNGLVGKAGWLAVRSVPVVEHDDLRLIFLPVKPLLDYSNPERSWDQIARFDAIRAGLCQLRRHHGNIALTLPGCGNGGLKAADVLPLLREFLPEPRFTLCDWDHPVEDLTGRQAGLTAAVDGLSMLDAALASAGLTVRDGELVRH